MDIREIEKIVDKHHLSADYFDKPFRQALFDLLRVYENECQLTDLGYSLRGSAPALDSIKRDLMDALNMAFHWIYERCGENEENSDNKKDIDFALDESEMIKTHDFLYDYCLPYSKICDAYVAYSRNRFLVDITNNDVYFKPTDVQNVTFTSEMGEFFDKYHKLDRFAKASQTVMFENQGKIRNSLSTVRFENGRICYENSSNDVFLKLADILWNETSLLPADWRFNDFSLEDYRLCWRELFAIAFMHSIACMSSGKLGMAYEDCVIVQSSECILRYLIDKTGLSDNTVSSVLGMMTFDYTLKHGDIMYQPLIVIEDCILITPSLLVNGVPERNLIALIQMINKDKNHFDEVNDLERLMRTQIEEHLHSKDDVVICYDIKLKSNGQTSTDVDFGIFDKKTNSVLLCELKWLLEADASWEVYAREDDVDHGCEQIEKAMGYAMNDSRTFMKTVFNIEVTDPVEFFCCVITKNNVRNNSKVVPVISQRKFMELLDENKRYRDIFEIIRDAKYKTQMAEGVKFDECIVKYAGFTFHVPAMVIPMDAVSVSG